LYVKQVANRSRIFVTIQATDIRGARHGAGRTASLSKGCCDPVNKLLLLIGGRSGYAFRRHLSVPNTESQHVPTRGFRSNGSGGGYLLNIEAGGSGRPLMAGLAISFQKALCVVEGIARLLRDKSDRQCEQCHQAACGPAKGHRTSINEFIITGQILPPTFLGRIVRVAI